MVQQGRRLTGSNIRPRVGSIGRATVAQNHDRRQFWRNVAQGMSSVEATTCCGGVIACRVPLVSREWRYESNLFNSTNIQVPFLRRT